MAKGSLGQTVGRFHARYRDKRPERLPEFEKLAASIGRARVVARAAAPQRVLHAVAQKQHMAGKTAAAQDAIPHPVPETKQAVRMGQQFVADAPGFATAFADFRKLPQQVRPADLAALRFDPRIAGIPVRHQRGRRNPAPAVHTPLARCARRVPGIR